jgi:hypothetical protein
MPTSCVPATRVQRWHTSVRPQAVAVRIPFRYVTRATRTTVVRFSAMTLRLERVRKGDPAANSDYQQSHQRHSAAPSLAPPLRTVWACYKGTVLLAPVSLGDQGGTASIRAFGMSHADRYGARGIAGAGAARNAPGSCGGTTFGVVFLPIPTLASCPTKHGPLRERPPDFGGLLFRRPDYHALIFMTMKIPAGR